VYFLEDSSWEDKGTGFIEGIYDQQQDEAILLVIEEDESAEQAESSGSQAPGGFLREPENPTYLLRSRVSKGGQYSRQQGTSVLPLRLSIDPAHSQTLVVADTLIVWTELDGTEIALSFQDPAACANICEFIGEVQQHLILVSGTGSAISSSINVAADN
jgi:protein phosphatase-4 regulatory subunit 3